MGCPPQVPEMNHIRHLWLNHRALFVGFALAVALTLFFAVRFAVFALHWSDPAHRHEPPEAWMTPNYIAHSWQVDPRDLGRALGLPPDHGRRPTLADIAAARGVPLEQVLAELQAYLDRMAPAQ